MGFGGPTVVPLFRGVIMTVPHDASPVKKERFPKVDVDEVMAKIRDELNLKKGEPSEATDPSLSRKIIGTRFGWRVKAGLKNTFIYRLFLGPLIRKIRAVRITHSGYLQAVETKDLLKHEDEKFIKETYKYLFHRMPDPEGLDFWLYRLRQVGWPKIKILWLIQRSREAQIHNVPIKGLKTRYFFYQTGRLFMGIPLIGWLTRLIISLCRLPTLARKIERMERHQRMIDTEKEYTQTLREDWQSISVRLTRLEKRMGTNDRYSRKKSRKNDH